MSDEKTKTPDLTRSQKLAAAGFVRRPSLWAMQAREALELIAAPMRPDGTWNRDREACRQLAAEALGRYDEPVIDNSPKTAAETAAAFVQEMPAVPAHGLGPLPARGDGVVWDPADGVLMLLERAASMLTGYGELIRRDGASHVEQHHYLPEVEHVAAELRALMDATPQALGSTDGAGPAHGCLSVKVKRELFRFHSQQEWVNKGKNWYANCGVPRGFYLTVDAAGHVVHIGKCFMEATAQRLYPITVYELQTNWASGA